MLTFREYRLPCKNKEPIRLIVAGGREFSRYGSVLHNIKRLNLKYEITEIISGGARGADKLGERAAKALGISIQQFLPDWDGLGNRAGMVRNREMGEYGDFLLVFWDGKSKGTKGMIDIANQLRLPMVLVRY